MNIQIKIIIVLFSFSLSACVATSYEGKSTDKTVVANEVVRWIDKEAGVVCWELQSGYAGGISCLPVKETLLGKK